VSPWIFTKSIIIDEKAIPHSHPVLTFGYSDGQVISNERSATTICSEIAQAQFQEPTCSELVGAGDKVVAHRPPRTDPGGIASDPRNS
jgi:hypothetical protein